MLTDGPTDAACSRADTVATGGTAMPVDVIMPQMGESIQEGTLVKWLKKPGDAIGRDEPLFEISTDKVDAEIPSPAAGVLKEIKVKEGETVAIKTVVAVIDTEGSTKAGAGAPAAEAPTAQERPPESQAARGEGPRPASAPAPARTEPSTPSRPTPAPAASGPSGGGGLRTPAATGIQTAPRGGGGTATLLEERLRTKSSPVVRKIA